MQSSISSKEFKPFPVEDANQTAFQLSISFCEHQQDVRSISVLDQTFHEDRKTEFPFLIGTCSRDRTVRIWNPLNAKCIKTLIGHQHFVGSVISIPSNNPYYTGENSIASGGNDKIINIWNLKNEHPYLTLIGHADTVCALSISPEGYLISGSWDKTARVWKGAECIWILKGHQHSVWAVLALPNGNIVTGSADHSIKLWRGENCIGTFMEHQDCVRGLSLLDDNGFVSCGNDSLLCLWSFDGECREHLSGHLSYVYSVSFNQKTQEIISGGEDRFLRIWKGGKCIQAIIHPGSVWCCCALPNGDIATGCSDGIARIWTRNSSRIAESAVLEAYSQSVSSQSLPSGTLGDLNVDKLPSIESLESFGGKDQELKLIRKENSIEAYQWSAAQHQWMKVGEVVDARSSSSKQLLYGKSYDYVFDVDIGDGQMRKLGYNQNENPYMVAQEFLWKEELDQSLLDTVAQFLVKNGKPITIGEQPSLVSDPFTGAHRYVPFEETESRPIQSKDVEMKNAMEPRKDSWSSISGKHFPMKIPLLFRSGNSAMIISKLMQFNKELNEHPENHSLALDENHCVEINKIAILLSETSPISSFSIKQYHLLTRTILARWPDRMLFPAIDLLRLLILHLDGEKVIKDDPNTFLKFSQMFLIPSTAAENQMLSLRFYNNAFASENMKILLMKYKEEILDKVADLLTNCSNNKILIGITSLIYNYSVLFMNEVDSYAQVKLQCLSLLNELLNVAKNNGDSEIIYRTMVALGNLIWHDENTLGLCSEFELRSSLVEILDRKDGIEGKVKDCIQELLQLLRIV